MKKLPRALVCSACSNQKRQIKRYVRGHSLKKNLGNKIQNVKISEICLQNIIASANWFRIYFWQYYCDWKNPIYVHLSSQILALEFALMIC